MHILTNKLPIQLIKHNKKLYAPIAVYGVTVLLQFYSKKGICPNGDVRKGDLIPLTNNNVFGETIRRLKFLVSYIKSEKVEFLSSIPDRIQGVDFMDSERRAAMIVSRRMTENTYTGR